MNNEPVAWIDPYDLERLPLYDCWVNGEKSKNSIPLYTNSIKELTNKEIDNLIADVAEKPTDEDLYDFALAILKKAQQ
jgi:hypothetical protein